MTGNRICNAACVILAGLLSACGSPEQGEGSPIAARADAPQTVVDAIAVGAGLVAQAPVSEIYSTSTTLRADRRATVIARTAGVVREIRVEEGDRVVEGQVLAVLEDDEQRIEFERTRAVDEIESREFQRAAQLFEDELLSREDYETARREAEEARHAFARAELNLNRTRIAAPFAGQILTRYVDSGATVSDGTPVFEIADLEPLYADVNVPERHVARLAPGQPVRLLADASGGVAQARIERIAPSVDPATGTVKVTLAVEGGSRLRPGAFVRTDIVTDTHADALVVPRSALVAEGRRWHLFRLGPEASTVQQLEVRLGFEEQDRVEILDVLEGDPLQAGDRVVVVGAPALTDGAAVQVIEGEPPGEPS